MREHATAVFGPGSAHAQLVKIKKFSSERKRASKKYCVDGPESAPPPTPELVNIKMRASASERAKNYFLCGDFWRVLKKIFSARAEAY